MGPPMHEETSGDSIMRSGLAAEERWMPVARRGGLLTWDGAASTLHRELLAFGGPESPLTEEKPRRWQHAL